MTKDEVTFKDENGSLVSYKDQSNKRFDSIEKDLKEMKETPTMKRKLSK